MIELFHRLFKTIVLRDIKAIDHQLEAEIVGSYRRGRVLVFNRSLKMNSSSSRC